MAKRVHGKPRPTSRPRQSRPAGPALQPSRKAVAPAVEAATLERAPRVALGTRAVPRTLSTDYSYVIKDLIRIGVLAGALLAGMGLLAFVLK